VLGVGPSGEKRTEMLSTDGGKNIKNKSMNSRYK